MCLQLEFSCVFTFSLPGVLYREFRDIMRILTTFLGKIHRNPALVENFCRRPKSVHQYCAKGSPTNTLKALWCICVFLLFPLKQAFWYKKQKVFLPVEALEFSELKTPLVYALFPLILGDLRRNCGLGGFGLPGGRRLGLMSGARPQISARKINKRSVSVRNGLRHDLGVQRLESKLHRCQNL